MAVSAIAHPRSASLERDSAQVVAASSPTNPARNAHPTHGPHAANAVYVPADGPHTRASGPHRLAFITCQCQAISPRWVNQLQGRKGGQKGKAAVLGLLERHGDGQSRMRATVVANNKRSSVMPVVRASVADGSSVYTDALPSYIGLDNQFAHQVIDHAECYVDGQVHTNGCENFWSLLKRTLKGTYVSVEPFHLFRYLDEQAFRFNNRKATDAERFVMAAVSAFGKRLTFKQLTAADASL